MAVRSIKKIRTPAQLRSIARSQVGAEISSQVGPYTSEKKDLVTRRQRALDDMNTLFSGLNTYEQQSLGMMKDYETQAGQLQKQAFDQGQARLDQFRQQRAAQAQALAQQTGGPVPISAFTDGIDPGNIYPQAAAGGLMGAIGAGQDQLAEQGRFATEVFPLVQTEERKQVQQSFEDKVRQVQDEIANIKGQRGGLVNKRYADLLAAERDYQIAGGTLGLNKRQFGEAKRAARASERLSWAQLRQQAKQANEQGRLARAELAQRKAEFKQTAIAKGLDIQTNKTNEARALLNQLTSGGDLKDYKVRADQSVGFMSARQAAKKGYYLLGSDKRVQKDTKYRNYYKQLTSTRTLPTNLSPISPTSIKPGTQTRDNPGGVPWGREAYSEVYRQLVSNGVDPAIAKKLVIQKYGLGKGWKAPVTQGPVQQKRPPSPKK